MTLIPVLRRLSQADVYEFGASLVHKASARTAKVTQRNLALKNQKQNKNKQTKNTYTLCVCVIHFSLMSVIL